MKNEWTDATTYSRDQVDKKQTAWELKLPSLRIWISNGHRDYPGEFILHCFALGLNTHRLNLKADCDIEKVKEKAVKICRMIANNFVSELNTI
jgi:hypothetical protein